MLLEPTSADDSEFPLINSYVPSWLRFTPISHLGHVSLGPERWLLPLFLYPMVDSLSPLSTLPFLSSHPKLKKS